MINKDEFHTIIVSKQKILRKYLIFLISLILFMLKLNVPSFGWQIEIDKDYVIDGPANVRIIPNGKIIESLPTGMIVKIKEIKNFGWYLIEYNLDQENRSGVKRGWTYKDNIRGPKGLPLSTLVKEGKVLIANKEIVIHSHTSTIELLGEKIHYHEKKYGWIAKPETPIIVNVYCLDGSLTKNEIIEIRLDYGGDSGSYYAFIKTKKGLPKNACIFVNGLIDEGKVVLDKIFPDENMINSYLPKAIDYGNGTKYTPKFSYEIGDFNNDGIGEVLTYTLYDFAPWHAFWNIYQVDNYGKLTNLGKIGDLVGP